MVVNAFFLKERKERYLFLLKSKKRRSEALKRLNHSSDIDEKHIMWLPSNANIYDILKKEGSPDQVFIISDSELDGSTMDLKEAIKETSSHGWGTIISSIHGKLAYYYDEEGQRRGILKR